MKKTAFVLTTLNLVAAALATAVDAQQPAPQSRQYGASVTAGVAAAPLGEPAKSYGLAAVPGFEIRRTRDRAYARQRRVEPGADWRYCTRSGTTAGRSATGASITHRSAS